MIKVLCRTPLEDTSSQKMSWRLPLPPFEKFSEYRKTQKPNLKSWATSLSLKCPAMTKQVMSRFRGHNQTLTTSILMTYSRTVVAVSRSRKFMRIDWAKFSGRMLDNWQDLITFDLVAKTGTNLQLTLTRSAIEMIKLKTEATFNP